MSIIKLLNKKLDRILFTTPSHGQKSPYLPNLEGFYNWDYSEIEGFDNLSDPAGAILMAQGRASDCYGAKNTFFLTQGATLGILAAMKSVIQEGDRVLVARNCHKSVYNGLVVTCARVDWLMPDKNDYFGIYGEIDPGEVENNLKLNQYKALIITSPTYEGVNSDIEAISKICKQYGVYLIVDEAHGALYNFSQNLPKTALEQGADFVINSLHKTAGAPNQCALLHVSNEIREDFEWRQVQRSINLFNTSSPSYPLLAAIEATINFLHSKEGSRVIDDLINNVENFKRDLRKEGWEFYDNENSDPTKILIKRPDVSGLELSKKLFEEFHIEDEMASEKGVLFLCGIGTTKAKLDKLKNAIKKVKLTEQKNESESSFQPFPFVKMLPFEAFWRDYAFVSKENALLKISSQMVVPYPPGIGILYPGEAIQEWHLEHLGDDVGVIK